MTSPLALTVEEVATALYDAGMPGNFRIQRPMDGVALIVLEGFWDIRTLTIKINALQESKRQSYMSTDRARAEYDDDLKVST